MWPPAASNTAGPGASCRDVTPTGMSTQVPHGPSRTARHSLQTSLRREARLVIAAGSRQAHGFQAALQHRAVGVLATCVPDPNPIQCRPLLSKWILDCSEGHLEGTFATDVEEELL